MIITINKNGLLLEKRKIHHSQLITTIWARIELIYLGFRIILEDQVTFITPPRRHCFAGELASNQGQEESVQSEDDSCRGSSCNPK